VVSIAPDLAVKPTGLIDSVADEASWYVKDNTTELLCETLVTRSRSHDLPRGESRNGSIPAGVLRIHKESIKKPLGYG
jgi:hypothetical protein